MAPTLGTNLGYGGAWALPLTCHWLAKSRKRLGADFPLIGTNGARSGDDVTRMLLAGAGAVEMCSAVMTGGFGVLGSAIDELGAYLQRKGLSAAELRGRAADLVGTYDQIPQRPDYWRGFVPQETLRQV
jgi:dihydroorotate dehydrogenase